MTNTYSGKSKLDLWAKVIIAKNIQTNEPIWGTLNDCGYPVPAILNIAVADGETIECVKNFKVVYNQDSVTEQFVDTCSVILTIPFTAFFWIKTNLGFINATAENFTFTKVIPICEFLKPNGNPITEREFRDCVDQSFAIVCDYEIEYINILPKTVPSSQTIQIILTATVIDKLGKYQDVLVYGVKETNETICCISDCCD